MGGRNFTQKPYSDDEKRVAQWLHDKAGIGGGDDPIGFLISSHEYINWERLDFKRQLVANVLALEAIQAAHVALQLDNDRLYGLLVAKSDESGL